jgi:hexosaminidase
MANPRAMAFAGVAWVPKEDKNSEDFNRRLQYYYRLLQRENINYYRPSGFLTVISLPDYGKKRNLISFRSEQYKPEIRYTLDGTAPSANSTFYTNPFFTSGRAELKAAIFNTGEIQGEIASYTANYHPAIGKK